MLLAVNFSRDALVRLQKTMIDNASERPPDSHHNHHCNFGFGIYRYILVKSVSWSFAIVIKDLFFIASHNRSRNCSFNFRWNIFKHSLKFRALWHSVFSYGTHLSSFFNLTIFFRWSSFIVMLTLIAWDISLTLTREFFSKSVFRYLSSLPTDVFYHFHHRDSYLRFATSE